MRKKQNEDEPGGVTAAFLFESIEYPDFDYPPGHYVPFPMAIVEIEMQDGYFLRLERLP